MTEEAINQFWNDLGFDYKDKHFPEVIEWFCIGYNAFCEKWEDDIIKSNCYKRAYQIFKTKGLFDIHVCPNTKECRDGVFRDIWD